MTNQSVLQLVENLFNIMNHLGDAMAGKNNITGLQLSLVTMEINTQASCKDYQLDLMVFRVYQLFVG